MIAARRILGCSLFFASFFLSPPFLREREKKNCEQQIKQKRRAV